MIVLIVRWSTALPVCKLGQSAKTKLAVLISGSFFSHSGSCPALRQCRLTVEELRRDALSHMEDTPLMDRYSDAIGDKQLRLFLASSGNIIDISLRLIGI